MRLAVVVLATACTLAVDVGSLFAHRGSTHVVGTVTAIDAKRVAVEDDSGKDSLGRLTRDTVIRGYGSGGRAAWTDIKVGDRVFIEMFGMPGGQQTATEIRLLHRERDSRGD